MSIETVANVTENVTQLGSSADPGFAIMLMIVACVMFVVIFAVALFWLNKRGKNNKFNKYSGDGSNNPDGVASVNVSVGQAVDFNFLKDWSIRNDNSTIRELQINKEVERKAEELGKPEKKKEHDWSMITTVLICIGFVGLIIMVGMNQMFNNGDLQTKLTASTADASSCNAKLEIFMQHFPTFLNQSAIINTTVNTIPGQGGVLHG